MGIPAYFSHIIKNYPNILQKFRKQLQVNHLYIDSNSIIYDSIRQIEYNGNDEEFERKLINIVCTNIETYIQQIAPSHLVYIAFDGVAPVAKLESTTYIDVYKSHGIMKKRINYVHNKINGPDINVSWNSTVAITPGTQFMDKLMIC